MSVDTFVQVAALVFYGLAAFGAGYGLCDHLARRQWQRHIEASTQRERELQAEVHRLSMALARVSAPPHRYRG